MDEVQRVRDASEVLTKSCFEESLEPGNARGRAHEESGGEEEVEPLVVESGLWLKQGEVVPSPVLSEVVNVGRLAWDATQIQGDDEEMVVYKFLVRAQSGK